MVYEQELSNRRSITIGATAVNISEIKARKVLYIRNTSTAAQVITVALDNFNAAVANIGIILSSGEYFIDSNSEGYKCWSGKISAISSAAGGTVSIMELPEE